MPLSSYKRKRLRFIFIVYWFLLVYILAALVWWFIALNNQNHQMADYKEAQLKTGNSFYTLELQKIKDSEKRKTAQYIGEGAVFFLVIMAGAFFIFQAVRRQLKLSQQQQNFMMAITHELKTPIAITKLNLETLQKRKLEEAQQQRLIQNTIQETNRLNALCNNILLVSQIEDKKYNIIKETFNLSDLVKECVNDFAERFPQRTYNSDITDDILIKGDRLLLQLAINNLIDNAIKYSDKQSAVIISLTDENGKTSLAVTDEGKGVPVEDRKKIFEKFYRTGNKATKEAKGTGLGLYLTKKIAQQHKAQVSMTDNIPAGSIFAIEFMPDRSTNEE
jgi:two-component system sensor histidine kinase CiaH